MVAPTLWALCTTSAIASTSRRAMPVSSCKVNTAASDTTRWVSMPAGSCEPRRARKVCSSRTPYTAPVAPVMAMTNRRGRSAIVLQQRLQFTRFVHLAHDVGAADEFAAHIQLRDGRPVRVFLDALTHFRIVQHIHGGDILDAAGLQDLDRPAGKAALRELGGALHEQHHRGGRHGFLDPVLYIAHSCLEKINWNSRILQGIARPLLAWPSCGFSPATSQTQPPSNRPRPVRAPAISAAGPWRGGRCGHRAVPASCPGPARCRTGASSARCACASRPLPAPSP